MTRREHLVTVSDVHLSQAHPASELDAAWMRYRRAEYHPDGDFEALVAHLLALCPDADRDRIELCFNGDLLDFDAPWVKDGDSSFDEFPTDEPGCTAHARRILADHPRWFAAAARLVDAGHRLLFVSGNHDVELYFGGVREAVLDALRAHARPGKVTEETVRFRRWFHVTEAGVYIEHGSQYDFMNCVLHPMLPVVRDRDRIHPVCGKLAFKRTGSRMGYMNPYYEENFLKGLTGHVGDFARHYALSGRRHIARTWVKGAAATSIDVWRERRSGSDTAFVEEGHELAAKETGADPDAIRSTFALGEESAERTMLPILRELQLDRLAALGLGTALVGAAAAAGGRRAAGATAVAALLGFAIYEAIVPKPDLRTYDSAPPRIRALHDIHHARALVMGHTHRPFERWENGLFSGNSGAWCPAFSDIECTQPVLDGRPFLWLTSDGPLLAGGLRWWRRNGVTSS